MSESDHDYFRRRAAEERAAVDRASDPVARRVHLELAARYDEAATVAGAVTAHVERFEAKLRQSRSG